MKQAAKSVNDNLVFIFTIGAFIALTFSVVLKLQLSKSFVETEIINTTQESNHTLTKIFINEAYPDIKHHLALEENIAQHATKLMQGEDLSAIDHRVRQFMRNTDVLKIKIYDPNGMTVYSTEHKQIGQNKSNNLGYMKAMQGELSSELTTRGKFSAIEGEVFDKNLIASYVPIQVNQNIVGVAELYTDRTNSIKNTESSFLKLLLSLPAITLLVLVLLIWIVRTAEKQRRLQNKNLDDINNQLRDAKNLADKANEAKSDFLAIMSHEIRTPLNGVIATLSLIDQKQLSQENKELVETSINSSELLTTVINDVLDYSKIQANKFALNKHTVDIQQLINEVARSYEYATQEKGLDFKVEFIGSNSSKVEADPVRIKQILNNYLNNALKFTEKGAIRLSVVQEADNNYLFAVNDTGIGIKQENLTNLFKDFSQVHTGSTRNYHGTGLGLSICNKLAIMMNGTTYVESELGQGSTFYARLKLSPAQTSKAGLSEQKIDIKKPLKLNQETFILVVEDNKVNQLIAQKMLEKLGYQFALTENGQECLEFTKHKTVDLILMDCQMPVMDGYEATKQLRQQGFTKPIIALTANAQDSDKQICYDAGMNDFLSKPFKKQEFEDVLSTNLNYS